MSSLRSPACLMDASCPLAGGFAQRLLRSSVSGCGLRESTAQDDSQGQTALCLALSPRRRLGPFLNRGAHKYE